MNNQDAEIQNDYREDLTRTNNNLFLLLGAIFFMMVLAMLCVATFLVMFMRGQPVSAQQVAPPVVEPVRMAPVEVATENYTINLPVTLAGSTPPKAAVSESQIWTVIKIKTMGYEMDGRRYDMAVFRRNESTDTVKAYCVNPGWDVPDIGAEYRLDTDGIFTPLDERENDPWQRFAMIQQ